MQKNNFINRLEQLSKDISREKEFLNDANKTLEKLKKNISDEKKVLDIEIAKKKEEEFNKNNFINLKKDLENGLEEIQLILNQSTELEKNMSQIINNDTNNKFLEPIKLNFIKIVKKINNVFSSFKSIKVNFSSLTNLDKLFNFEEEYNQWTKRINDSVKQNQELLNRKIIIEDEIKKLEIKPAEINQNIGDLDKKVNVIEEKIKSIEKEMIINPDSAKEIDEKIRNNSELKIKKHEEKIRIETDLDYLKNDLENAFQEGKNNLSLTLNKEILEKEKLNPNDLPAKGVIQNELNNEKRKFDNIGPINFKAESERNETNKKIEKLMNQKVDVEKAVLKLRSSISEINKEGREKLKNSFDGINQSFKKLFIEFFNGGKAFLKMIGSSDPLQAGLEVFVLPPGKKLGTISLLSGGEKAMTATALILAVFLQNPSPICVLDEVDAPLDDINIEKFCNIIKKINEDTLTKFIVITHNPISMTHMNRLYGVTMSEKGVSQLISIKLDEAQKLREVG